jgi:hypothetical protein
MSTDTWIAEFYPIPAQDCLDEDALDHAILKWSGLTAKSMNKHHITVVPINVDNTTCALCFHSPDCERCPLYESRDQVACDARTDEEENRDNEYAGSPYHAFTRCDDPQPMIDALDKAKVWVLAQAHQDTTP